MDEAYNGHLDFIDLAPDSPYGPREEAIPDDSCISPSEERRIVGNINKRFGQMAVIAASQEVEPARLERIQK